jgi:hypothetical protein
MMMVMLFIDLFDVYPNLVYSHDVPSPSYWSRYNMAFVLMMFTMADESRHDQAAPNTDHQAINSTFTIRYYSILDSIWYFLLMKHSLAIVAFRTFVLRCSQALPPQQLRATNLFHRHL